MAVDQARLNEFMGKLVNEIGAVMHAATVVVGDQLGLYKKLAAGAMRVQEVGLCPGAQAREKAIRNVVTGAGFGHFRRVAQTPFNLIQEARA